MQDDPIVAEIRRIREEFAARFNYDIDAIGEYARQCDAAGDRKVIRLPRRPPSAPAVTKAQALTPAAIER